MQNVVTHVLPNHCMSLALDKEKLQQRIGVSLKCQVYKLKQIRQDLVRRYLIWILIAVMKTSSLSQPKQKKRKERQQELGPKAQSKSNPIKTTEGNKAKHQNEEYNKVVHFSSPVKHSRMTKNFALLAGDTNEDTHQSGSLEAGHQDDQEFLVQSKGPKSTTKSNLTRS